MSALTIPHPDPTTPAEQVENGLALFAHNGITRQAITDVIDEARDDFNMASCTYCVAGLVVSWSGRWSLVGYEEADTVEYRRDIVFGFDTLTESDEHGFAKLEKAWLDALGID